MGLLRLLGDGSEGAGFSVVLAEGGTLSVLDSPAAANGVGASAENHLAGNATATTMPVQNTFVPVASSGWSSDIAPRGMTTSAASGAITSQTAGRFWIICSLAFTSGAAPQTVQFQVFKNGSPLISHSATTWTDTAAFPNTVSMTGLDDLAPGDVLDLRVRCTTAAGIAITVTDANLSIA